MTYRCSSNLYILSSSASVPTKGVFTNEELNLGFMGFGQMGSAIATRLRDAGYHVCVFDPDPVAQSLASSAGFELASSPAEAASETAVVFLCLPDARAVESVTIGGEGAASWRTPPAFCVDLTSSLPAVTRRVGRVLAKRGVHLIDAPVSGGVAGAREGRLTVMAGGEPTIVDEMRHVLSTFASAVIWAGPLGAGHAVKAFNNTLSAASLIGTAEATAAGLAAGMSLTQVIDAVNDSTARSQNSEVKYPRNILTGTFDAGFRLGLLHKDVVGACLIAEECRFPVPVAALTREILAGGVRQLGLAADFTRIYETVVPDCGRGAIERAEIVAADAEALNRALFGMLLLASVEIVGLAQDSGVDVEQTFSIFNLSSGRNECTRALSSVSGEIRALRANCSVETILEALRWVTARGRERRGPLPMAALAAELWASIAREVGPDADAWRAMDHRNVREGENYAR